MKSSQYDIFDVAKDLVTGNLEMATESTIATRRSMCDECDARNSSFDVCTACGCIIKIKIKLQPSTCPMGKW